MMNSVRVNTNVHGAHDGKFALDRRSAFLFAIAGMVGGIARVRRARAEPRRRGRSGDGDDRGNPKTAQFPNLKAVGPQGQVIAICQRRNNFEVTTADGRTTVFRESDLRFKVDSSARGPAAGRAVILPGGMMGDRAIAFFASPSEIGTFIEYPG
ncbi:MAG: hypothetical protein ACREDL_12960 [Bradyrhizobium sp.]